MTIVTEHKFPPIPDRRFDWVAYVEGEEEDGPYGYGETEADAIEALVAQLEDEEPDISEAVNRAHERFEGMER